MTQTQAIHDLLVIGGGINGVGIAADAAGRGLDVVLCEKSDLAAATSSWSTKLIHGGLRYLEQFEFGLVRKSLKERDVLTWAAPHLIRPIAFHIPQMAHSRNALMLRAGLLLYDNLAPRKLFQRSHAVKYGTDSPLNASIRRGFQYWDAQVDDSRLVVLNAVQARIKGAMILTRTECTAIEATDQGWRVTLTDNATGNSRTRLCRVIVNASGPWVSDLLQRLTHKPAPHSIRLVKGSHIVVPRIHDGEQAFLLQHHDGRVIFVIPYLGKYSLIGTTEEEFAGDLDRVSISEAEREYLVAIVNLYFKHRIRQSDVVYTYSGVRPLIDEREQSASRVSRDYRIEHGTEPFPLLSIYGGKVTTYRLLAEEVMIRLGRYFPRMGRSWTARAKLPGGDFDSREELFRDLAGTYAWLGPKLLRRWLDGYGTLTPEIIGNAGGLDDLGTRFGGDLYQREVDYLCTAEWARTADDILWRRSKLGYEFREHEKAALSNYIERAFGG